MSTRVRAARAGEGARLGEIFLAAGKAAWAGQLPDEGLASVRSPAFEWEEQIADPEVICLVAEQGCEIAAFVVLRPSPDPDSDPSAVALLDRIYTDPPLWRQGLGTALLKAAMEELGSQGFGEATLWTATWNRSHGFYEANGWRLNGATRNRTFAGATYTEVRYRIDV
jgi:GNAT superfamily N-acetyltransferase